MQCENQYCRLRPHLVHTAFNLDGTPVSGTADCTRFLYPAENSIAELAEEEIEIEL
jgi:hypothetical protein